jgi:hypothetical protein
MATLAEKWSLRTSEALRTRLAQAMQDAAYAISNEDPATPDHVNRLAWASGVLANSSAAYGEARRVQWRLALNPTIAAAGEAATDGELEYVLIAEILPAILAQIGA